MCTLMGCQWELGGQGPGVFGARPAGSYLYHGAALRIYFCFQFPNFDSLAWRPGLSGSQLCRWREACMGAWQAAAGKARRHIMAMAAAGKEGSSESRVGQGVQMWGPSARWAPPRRTYSNSCCPWRTWGLPESELGALSLHWSRGLLPQPIPSS